MTLYRAGADSPIVRRWCAPPRTASRWRSRRAQGALRRGEQHRVGARAGAGRRPRGLRRRRPQDPRQDRAGRPPRGHGAASLRPLGTGNYNAATARVYTDFGLFTARAEFGEDATELFNSLTGFSKKTRYKRLAVAPICTAREGRALIDREAEKARQGKPAAIIAKMNALVDPRVIHALYRASQAGVPIELSVRGICCLRPGVPGVSDASASPASSAASSSTAASSPSASATSRRSTSPAPTGCPATSTGGSS